MDTGRRKEEELGSPMQTHRRVGSLCILATFSIFVLQFLRCLGEWLPGDALIYWRSDGPGE